MIPKEGLDIKYVLAAIRRRLWYIAIPFFLAMMAAVTYCIKAPRIYRSSSLILVQPQEVPSDYVRPTVTSDVQFRLNAIMDEIMSRSKLEEIIKKFDLYRQIHTPGDIREAVEVMRNEIDIKLRRTGRRGEGLTSFSVSFRGEDPKKVKAVTTALTDLFIEYNSKLRQEQAAGTSKFLEIELSKVKEELRQWEHRVREFKQKHVGFLPENMESNYRIMAQLQQRLDSLNTTLQKTEDRKLHLQAQHIKLETSQGDSLATRQPQTLDGLRQQLQNLQLRYSDRHPDIKRLKALIAKLEKEKEISAFTAHAKASGEMSSSEAERLMRAQKEDRFGELTLIDKEIFELRKEISETESQIDQYRRRIEKGPEIEAMFVDLRRGYEQTNANYRSLYQKRLQADLAQNLEHTKKGEQFRIQDKAYLPRKPYKPDLRRILSMGLMLALGSGFGLALLREYLDPTFWSNKDLENVLELPVLVSVPVIRTEKERRWRTIRMVAAVCVLLVMTSTLLFALLILWKKNPGFLPLPI
jgi:polysaccharide chain length determinant protein (PEP-CTERM system associated)